jgi:hypothetical protein
VVLLAFFGKIRKGISSIGGNIIGAGTYNAESKYKDLIYFPIPPLDTSSRTRPIRHNIFRKIVFETKI